MNFQGIWVGFLMLFVALIWIFKPGWLLKLSLSRKAPEWKVKLMTKVVQFIGVFAALVALYSMIYTIFFVK